MIYYSPVFFFARDVRSGNHQNAICQNAIGRKANGRKANGQNAIGQKAIGQKASGQKLKGQKANGQKWCFILAKQKLKNKQNHSKHEVRRFRPFAFRPFDPTSLIH